MKIKDFLKDIFEYFLSVFFPNKCIFCGELIGPFDEMCKDCKSSLPWIDGEICHYCGSSENDCYCKKRHGHFYDGIISPLYYVGNVRKCIHDLKFKDERHNADVFGNLMNQIRIKEYPNILFDYVTYIPMTEKQEKKRGYNQGRLLAKKLAELSSIPLGDKLIVKLYKTDTQHKCNNISERYGNLLGAYDVNPEYDIVGKIILLVDDVKTSGATLNECSKMLYLNGAESVYCITATLGNKKVKESYKKEELECLEQK